MPKKKDTGLNSPSIGHAQLKANLGGFPVTKDVKAIDKTNMPPKTPPASKIGPGVSVRV